MEKHEDAYIDYMNGMKYTEIAEKYNTTINTVKSWKKRYEWKRKGAITEKMVRTKGAPNETEISWMSIEHEFVTDIRKKPINLIRLAKKYNLHYEYLRKYASEKHWSEKRKKYIAETSQKVIEKTMDSDSDRIIRILKLADKTAEKTEKALNELESYVVHNKTKTKEIEYKDTSAIGKPTKEVIQENETLETVIGPVDRLGLTQIAGALKNLKEIYMTPMAIDDMKAAKEFDKRKLEIELLKLERNAPMQNAPEEPDNNFLDALNAVAGEVWGDTEVE